LCNSGQNEVKVSKGQGRNQMVEAFASKVSVEFYLLANKI